MDLIEAILGYILILSVILAIVLIWHVIKYYTGYTGLTILSLITIAYIAKVVKSRLD